MTVEYIEKRCANHETIHKTSHAAVGGSADPFGSARSDDRRICSICPPERVILGIYLIEDLEGVYVQFSNEDGTGWSLIRVE